MNSLFVLVSTGQPVANLPPVLEHSEPGDFVLWVESAEARQKNWMNSARSVLEDRGLVTAGVIETERLNDPATLSVALAQFAAGAQGQYKRVFLVANGGNKLSPIGLILGLKSLNPEVLYGDDSPAVCSHYLTEFSKSPDIQPYTRHDLDLPDILRLSGHLIHNGNDVVRLWPSSLSLPYKNEPYGRDESYTYKLHADHHARASAPPADRPVPFAELSLLTPDRYRRWLRNVQQVRDSGAINPQVLCGLYNGTLELDRIARTSAAGRGFPQPAARLGESVERAVARRLHQWLEVVRHPAVQSAWANVIVARDSDPHRAVVNFDVLVVLRNGVLIHLECKSGDICVRDLDARIYRLRTTSSQLARQVVVLPMFTRQASEPWFVQLHEHKLELEQAGLSVLPFTWEQQPDSTEIPGLPSALPFPVPSFESELDRFLSRYR